jgi:protein-tyrosine phosphatase
VEEQFSPEDQAALGWAFGSGSPSVESLRERVLQGEQLTSDDVVAVRREWDAAGRPVYQRHVHRDVVELPDGTAVIAVSFADDPYARKTAPAFGLYLDARWDPPWPHEHLAWPDFGLPDRDELGAALPRLLARARRGDVVEIGCHGGHGRTGSALACLAVLTGVPADSAVDWVRAHYCPKAVETDEQRAFVESFSTRL